MKEFYKLKPGEQFMFPTANMKRGTDVYDVYTALSGPRPSDTFFIDSQFIVREAFPNEWVLTKVMRAYWE